jgi:hypothetical protein
VRQPVPERIEGREQPPDAKRRPEPEQRLEGAWSERRL